MTNPYDFWSNGLPENNNQPNVFLTLITSSVFCYNRNEIWQILDKYNDTWQPVNAVSYNAQWYNDYATDINAASNTDIERAIAEYEDYIGKSNITGFVFHVPWYWDTADDAFIPMNSVIPVAYEGQENIHLYKKAKDEGYVHFDNTPRSCTITRAGGTATGYLANHEFLNGYIVTITGADQWQYNGTHQIYNVTPNTFDYTVPWDPGDEGDPEAIPPIPPIPESPPTPATGTIYVSRNTLVNASGAKLLSLPYSPALGGVPIANARKMPTKNGIPLFGGTPDDAGLKEGIQYVIDKGYKFIFYSFMEVADSPTVTKPWRGSLLPTHVSVTTFMDRIKAQHLFYAQFLVDNNLRPYAFVTTSEMKELNRHKTYSPTGQYTDDGGTFDFTAIAKWKEIYNEVKAIFNAAGWTDVLVGYSADWSEFNGFNIGDGYYWRPLDELFMHQDAVFMDAYFGITEDKSTDRNYLDFKNGWFNGRDWDYYISDYDAWKNYTNGKTTISAPEFAAKNLKWWKENTHDHIGPPPGYTRTQTPWTANAKKIFFVEVGCPSIESGATEPNLFFDPEAIQGGIPRGSDVKVTLTRSGSVVTATTVSGNHGYSIGDKIMVSGAGQGGYNGEQIVTEITSGAIFKYEITGTPSSPATGSIYTLKRNDAVQHYYHKSLHENMVSGNIPIMGVAVWQCDSRPLSTLEGVGKTFWGDAYRVGFVHWLKYLTSYQDSKIGQLALQALRSINPSSASVNQLLAQILYGSYPTTGRTSQLAAQVLRSVIPPWAGIGQVISQVLRSGSVFDVRLGQLVAEVLVGAYSPVASTGQLIAEVLTGAYPSIPRVGQLVAEVLTGSSPYEGRSSQLIVEVLRRDSIGDGYPANVGQIIIEILTLSNAASDLEDAVCKSEALPDYSIATGGYGSKSDVADDRGTKSLP